jgi:hypothetical protein
LHKKGRLILLAGIDTSGPKRTFDQPAANGRSEPLFVNDVVFEALTPCSERGTRRDGKTG